MSVNNLHFYDNLLYLSCTFPIKKKHKLSNQINDVPQCKPIENTFFKILFYS